MIIMATMYPLNDIIQADTNSFVYSFCIETHGPYRIVARGIGYYSIMETILRTAFIDFY